MTTETGKAGKTTGVIAVAGAVLAVGIGVVWYLWSQDQGVESPDPVAVSNAPTADPSPSEPPQSEAAGTDDVPPSPPVTEDGPDATPADPAAAGSVPGFDVVRVDPDGSAVIAGHAAPGSTVQLTLDGAPLEDVMVGSDGNFVALLDLPTETPGALGLSALDDDGKIVENGQSPQTVLIAPTRPAAAPDPVAPVTEVPETDGDTVIAAAPTPAPETDGTPASAPSDATAPQVLLADDEGISVLQDGTGRPAVDNIVIDAITYDETGDVALSGRGQSGANLRVYLDNEPIEIGEVSENGQWRVPLPKVDSGVYTLRVDELGQDGSVTSRTETPFKREEPAQLAAVGTAEVQTPQARVEAVTVQPGSTLWAIAREHLGEGPLYVRVFAANREQIRDPDLIYPGQVFAIPEAE